MMHLAARDKNGRKWKKCPGEGRWRKVIYSSENVIIEYTAAAHSLSIPMLSTLSVSRLTFLITRRAIARNPSTILRPTATRLYATSLPKTPSSCLCFSPWSNHFPGSLHTRIFLQSGVYALLIVGLMEVFEYLWVWWVPIVWAHWSVNGPVERGGNSGNSQTDTVCLPGRAQICNSRT